MQTKFAGTAGSARCRKGVAALAVILAAGTLAACGDTPLPSASLGLPRQPTGFVSEQQRGYVSTQNALDQLPIGSSQEQVLLVLGTPSTVATVDGEVFYYISQRTKKVMFMRPEIIDQRVMAIYFDPKDKRVTRIADYGLQDGKVFDFVSRTTPTSGGELSFLGQIFSATGFAGG
ncbi:outer membrane protein assembly factor BamE [Ancylobacter lacus]|uniref:outer membrane protein assembly factor BamE n=1 Tax=Ancylobacter lacus TaxID=2579970 RepID=UPI001BD06975|nr:outer membrane protein assembly factor BamE [Ancylobacter lacus]MBS7537429.1 outer membrane protein assembly factor BamE [Ancylobacter lacus]